ncbi:MAG: DNA polymerase/3'-5' exonuclease PolX [Candidatus Spechtbacteria bacterium]|nr:DNA polymerase/3'-5' exonuclease PolX [Candidatus Spechtbacteria bacterium]
MVLCIWPMSANTEIAKIFSEMASFFQMKDDRFRARAYENGAEILESLTLNVKQIYTEKGVKGLEELQGIGRGMAEKIEEYLTSGKVREYEALKQKMPVDMLGLRTVEGLGPKSIKVLYEKLGIKNLKDLENAARGGKIRKLTGFGEKKERNILEGIEFVKKNSGRMLLGYVWPKVLELAEEFKNMKEVIAIEPCGSLRRRKETIGDIDLLVASDEPEKVIERFVGMRDVVKVWGKGPTKASVRLEDNFDTDVRVVPKESWGSALQYFTGSKTHNVKLRQIAIEKGLKLNEYGLFDGKKKIAGETEEGVYQALGLTYIEPELREDTGEIEALRQGGKLPKIIPYGSLLGDLQVQTNWTDGEHSIEEMARAATAAGLQYIAITDHTKSLAMTGGSDEKKLLRQVAEIEKLNREIKGIKILTGAEVNILRDGSLDIGDEVLSKLDVVGASVHSLFKMPRADMTQRIIRAIQNPHVDILFHPTGRLIQKREAYEVDMEAVIKEAVKTRTILEINAYPARLDLSDEHIRLAQRYGAKFVIDSDAHSAEHFKYLDFGVAQARRGWTTADDVLNTLPVEEFLRKLKSN